MQGGHHEAQKLTTRTLFFQSAVEIGFWSGENHSRSKSAVTASAEAELIRVCQFASRAPAVAAMMAILPPKKN